MENSKIRKRLNLIAIVASIIIVMAALFIFIRIDKKGSNHKSLKFDISQIEDKNYIDSIKQGSQKEKEIVLVEAAKDLRLEIHTVTDNKHKDFIIDDFTKVNPIIDFIMAVDSKNGHAIYFKGEVYRLLNDYDGFLKYFQLYLSIEDSIGSTLPKVANAQLCYETPHGYCEQRTAWISQLLANYYYKRGTDESDLNKKYEAFKVSMLHIKNVRIHYPAGFKTSSVTISTIDLEKNLKEILTNQ